MPGVLLLDECLRSIAAACGVATTECAIVTAKFLSPARPGEDLSLHFDPAGGGRVTFAIRTSDRLVAAGSLGIPSVAPAAHAT